MIFSHLFKCTNLAVDVKETPVERFMREHNTPTKVNLFLGHTVEDSPDEEEQDVMRFFQESSLDTQISPCESYVSISEHLYFDPRDVHVEKKVLVAFIKNPIPKSLISIPGIDVNKNRILKREGFDTTHQLIGKFLMFDSGSVTREDTANAFYRWLDHVGVIENKATITASLAEKIGTWIPGFYDASVYKI